MDEHTDQMEGARRRGHSDAVQERPRDTDAAVPQSPGRSGGHPLKTAEMPATTALQTEHDPPPGECWCCGKAHPATSLLNLGNHPQVTVCLWCADFLARRAGERRDHLRPSLAGRARDVLRAGRRIVMDHGWQRMPVVGPFLRWLGRDLP